MPCVRITDDRESVEFKAGECIPGEGPCPNAPHLGGDCTGIHPTADITVEPLNDVFMCGPGVGTDWVCSSCGAASTRLCDYPIGPDGQTCSAALCDDHAMRPDETRWPAAPDDLASRRGGPMVRRQQKQRQAVADLDFCPVHWLQLQTKP